MEVPNCWLPPAPVTVELKIFNPDVSTFGIIGFGMELSSSLNVVLPAFTHQFELEFKLLFVAYAIFVVGSPLKEFTVSVVSNPKTNP